MNTLAMDQANTMQASSRWLQLIGTFGLFLALVILGASMLLRLSTIFGVDGQTISTLPVGVETASRMAHRVAASGVGLLVLCAVALCLTRRPAPAHVVKPVAGVVTATILLALIGPLTPGYKVTAITVGNVVLGMVLLIAFAWLRESSISDSSSHQPVEPLLGATFLVFLLHVATGAAASASEMHGTRALSLLHIGTALLSTMFIGAVLWARRKDPLLYARVAATACILTAQLVLGFTLVSLGARPIWLSILHGMLSPLLALALVSIAMCESQKCA